MSDPGSLPDAERSRLRALVATIEHELAALSQKGGSAQMPPANELLLSSWAALVAQLALGPEPEVRQCPVCKNFGMKAATRCGFCWAKLTPEKDAHALG